MVGAGFAYDSVLDMTWSQLTSYSKAIELDRIGQWRMELAITHNPYAKDKETAMKLWQHLDQMERSIGQAGENGWEPKRPKGMSLKQLERVMGKVKGEVVSRDEWERHRTEQLEKKQMAQQAMSALRVKQGRPAMRPTNGSEAG